MDAINKKILTILQKNAKLNTKEVAQHVGLSTTPTYERIRKLEEAGLIKKYVAILDRDKIKKEIIAYCQVTLYKHEKTLLDKFKKDIQQNVEVMECHKVSGDFDFLIKIVANDMKHFQFFINEKLTIVEGISKFRSSFVMETIKEETAYTL